MEKCFRQLLADISITMEDAVDSLEDWVAIKDHPFLEKDVPRVRIDFFVAWNSVEEKIAVTCKEGRRTASDLSPQGWSALFNFHELQSVHEQLALVHPSLGPYLPQLPIEPRGVWAYIVRPEPPDVDICNKIHDYLHIALNICGHKLLVTTLFEEHSIEEYFESISELRRRYFDEAITNAEEELQNILFLRTGSVNMLDMEEVYTQEDRAWFKKNIALSTLYNYLIQPFLDMREVAMSRSREAKHGLVDPHIGARRKEEYAVMFSEWNENYLHALDRIQELYLEYYEKTVRLLTGTQIFFGGSDF